MLFKTFALSDHSNVDNLNKVIQAFCDGVGPHNVVSINTITQVDSYWNAYTQVRTASHVTVWYRKEKQDQKESFQALVGCVDPY